MHDRVSELHGEDPSFVDERRAEELRYDPRPLGTITIDDSSLTVTVEDREPQVTRFAPPLSASSYHPEWFAPLLEDFRAEVLHADQRGRNLSEAGWCAELLFAAYESRGEVVRFETPETDPPEPVAGPAAEDLSAAESSSEPDTER